MNLNDTDVTGNCPTSLPATGRMPLIRDKDCKNKRKFMQFASKNQSARHIFLFYKMFLLRAGAAGCLRRFCPHPLRGGCAALAEHARSRRRAAIVWARYTPPAGQAQHRMPTRLFLSPHLPGMQEDARHQHVHSKIASPACGQTVRAGKKGSGPWQPLPLLTSPEPLAMAQSHLAKQVPNHNEKKCSVVGSPGHSPPPPAPVTPRARRLSRRSPIRRRCPPSCLSCRWCCSAPPRGCNG